MEPVQSDSKLRCCDIAAKTLEKLTRMNDMNTQMQRQIRSITSAPVLHPTIAPPPVSADSDDLGAKLITIIDLQSEVAQLPTNLANPVNGGSMDHFMVAQGSLDWLPMLVKDMVILNTGLHSTVPNLITCMNDTGYIDDISVPPVLCIVRE